MCREAFENILSAHNYKISKESDLADILGLDFISKDGRYGGNVGFLFEDDLNKHTFTFYVTKSFDENNQRHFKRINIAEHVELDFIENNYSSLLSDSLKVYGSLKDEDLDTIIKLQF